VAAPVDRAVKASPAGGLRPALTAIPVCSTVNNSPVFAMGTNPGKVQGFFGTSTKNPPTQTRGAR
jgi:hypothetical protein